MRVNAIPQTFEHTLRQQCVERVMSEYGAHLTIDEVIAQAETLYHYIAEGTKP